MFVRAQTPMVESTPMQRAKPNTEHGHSSDADNGAGARSPGRIESAVELLGPFAIGTGTVCYGVISKQLSVGSALAAGGGLWQASRSIVMLGKVATAEDDADDAERMRLGYGPRRHSRARR